MEGLIKGLADVALGFLGGDRDDLSDNQSATEREERSKSTWAEVVSTGKPEGQEKQQGSSSYVYPSNIRRSRKEEDQVHGSEEKTDGDWEIVGQGSHKKKHHPLVAHKGPFVLIYSLLLHGH